jgi:hypothetical protein
MIRCAFDGCHKKTEQPSTDGWAYLCKYGPGIKDGSYCPAHADAIERERVLLAGGGLEGGSKP